MRIGTQGIAQIKSDEAVYRLRDAIIVSAANDYRNLCRRMHKNVRTIIEGCGQKKADKLFDDLTNLNNSMRRMEVRFFESDWYTALTEVDGRYITKRIRKEVKHEEEVEEES